MEVIRENVSPLVQVEVDEVRREGAESDEHPVSGDCGTEAWSIRLVPRQDERGSAERDPLGRAPRPVAYEDVGLAVGVAPDEVLSKRGEGNDAPVGSDGRSEARAVAQHA